VLLQFFLFCWIYLIQVLVFLLQFFLFCWIYLIQVKNKMIKEINTLIQVLLEFVTYTKNLQIIFWFVIYVLGYYLLLFLYSLLDLGQLEYSYLLIFYLWLWFLCQHIIYIFFLFIFFSYCLSKVLSFFSFLSEVLSFFSCLSRVQDLFFFF